MSSTGSVDHDDSLLRRAGRSRSVRIVAATLTSALAIGAVATAGGGSATAATTYSTNASGRFLSGTIADLNLDKVAGIEGETASNKFGPTVTNKNSLKAELLDKAIEIPLQSGLQLPGLNVLQLGAVGQYATASPDGSALGATGAVSNSGGVGLGGSNGEPASADLDLSGLGGSQLSQLINVKAGLGAVSSGAVQAPVTGERSVDKNCGSAHKKTVEDGAQAGVYCIAGANITLSLPVLSGLLEQVLTPVSTLLDSVTQTLSATGAVTVPSLSDAIAKLETINVGNGVLINLSNKTQTIDGTSVPKGSIVIDLAAAVKDVLGKDINDLPPDTSLIPVVVKALANVPSALGDLASNVVAAVNSVVSGIKVGGVAVGSTILTPLLSGLTTILNTLTTTLNTVVGQLTPIFDLLPNLIEIIVNGQEKSGGVFTETAVRLNLIGGQLGSALTDALKPIITALDGLLGKASTSSTVTNATRSTVATTEANVRTAAQQSKNGTASTNGKVQSLSKTVRIPAIKTFAVKSAALPNAVVALNLAQSSVGPVTDRGTPVSPTPTSHGATPTSAVPTGVPAGAGSNGGSPTLPLVLILLTVALAAGGVVTYRIRGSRGMH